MRLTEQELFEKLNNLKHEYVFVKDKTWKNNKTGNLYEIVSVYVNVTNAQDGDFMIGYVKYGEESWNPIVYVRKLEEFLEKFTKINLPLEEQNATN